MGWKKKEKELTPEEAIEKAKETLAPYWLNSEPLIAGIDHNKKVSAIYSLSDEFESQSWLILFLDITEEHAYTYLNTFSDWIDEYASFNIRFMLIIKATGKYIETENFIPNFIEDLELKNPIVIDHDGTIQESMEIRKYPSFVFFDQGKKLFSDENLRSLHQTEVFIQDFLRQTDPGLPLNPPEKKNITQIQPVRSIELNHKSPYQFKILKEKSSIEEIKKSLDKDTVLLFGKWNRDQEKIWTEDKKAELYFLSHHERLSLISASMSKVFELGKIAVEVEGTPAYTAFAGKDLITDDDGRSCVMIRKERTYQIFKALPKDQNLICFKMITANRIELALFAFRFSENLKD